jgi:ABC-type transporter Mla subunit MlaD
VPYEHEELLNKITAFARVQGKNPGEIQTLIIAGSLLLGFEQLSSSIAEQTEAIESQTESINRLVTAGDTLDDAIRESSDDLKDALTSLGEVLTESSDDEKKD